MFSFCWFYSEDEEAEEITSKGDGGGGRVGDKVTSWSSSSNVREGLEVVLTLPPPMASLAQKDDVEGLKVGDDSEELEEEGGGRSRDDDGEGSNGGDDGEGSNSGDDGEGSNGGDDGKGSSDGDGDRLASIRSFLASSRYECEPLYY